VCGKETLYLLLNCQFNQMTTITATSLEWYQGLQIVLVFSDQILRYIVLEWRQTSDRQVKGILLLVLK